VAEVGWMKCRLKEILDEKGIKHVWLANEVGIYKATLSKIVNGKSTPSLEIALKIAKALHISIHEIWELEE
jgi:putative transcriptional regulator